MKMDRETYIKKTAGAALIFLLVASIMGCSNPDEGLKDEDAKETPQSKCLEKGALGLVVSNHGHELIIPKEDVAAAEQKTYSIQGVADHSHTLTVKSEDFTAMKNNAGADIYSSTENDHRHSVIIRCAP